MNSIIKKGVFLSAAVFCALSTFADCDGGEVWINREDITANVKTWFDGDFMHIYAQTGESVEVHLNGIFGSCDSSSIDVWVEDLPAGLSFNRATYMISGTITAAPKKYEATIFAKNHYEKEREAIYFHVTADAGELPSLEESEYSFKKYKGFSLNEEYEIQNLQGGKVTLKKIGKGKLPSGVKLKYDKKTGKVVLSGAPSKAGTFEYVIRIDEKVGRETREGVETTFKFEVEDMGDLLSSHPDYNAAAGKKMTASIPLFSEYREESLEGLLSVSISAKGSITAKFKDVFKKTYSFKGSWQDVENGELSAVLTTKTGLALTIWLSPDGSLSAYLEDQKNDLGLAYTAYGVNALATDFSEYEGEHVVYTDDNEAIDLKINKKGKVSYKSTTNRAIKGTTQLILANDFEGGVIAQVCLMKTSGKTSYAYVVELCTDCSPLPDSPSDDDCSDCSPVLGL